MQKGFSLPYFGETFLHLGQMLLDFGETLLPTGFSRLTVGNSSLDFGEMQLQSGNLPLQKGNSLLQTGDNLLHSGQILPTNPPTASTFAFAPNHTNQPQGQSQKSLPADTSEKEIFKNAPPHNKNKIHHSGQRTLTTEDR